MSDQTPIDAALRSRVADLLHLLQFARIETPSAGDAEEAERAMNDLKRMLAAPVEAPAVVRLPEGVTIDKDFMGTVHIKLGDFDFIQIRYDHRYTYNSHQAWVANKIIEAVLTPAAPVAREPARELKGYACDRLGALIPARCGDCLCWPAYEHASTTPPAAQQPGTVKVPRELLAEAESIIESYAEALKASHAPGGDWEGEEAAHDDYEREAGVASKLRALLRGGEA